MEKDWMQEYKNRKKIKRLRWTDIRWNYVNNGKKTAGWPFFAAAE